MPRQCRFHGHRRNYLFGLVVVLILIIFVIFVILMEIIMTGIIFSAQASASIAGRFCAANMAGLNVPDLQEAHGDGGEDK